MNKIYLLCCLLFSLQVYASNTQDDAAIWATRLTESVMAEHPVSWEMRKSDGDFRWSYTVGLVLAGFQEFDELKSNTKIEKYVNSYIDHYVDKQGNIATYQIDEFNIDSVDSGKLLFSIYEKSGDSRYLAALQNLRKQLEWHPRTRGGFFWHKRKYPWQIWLDGLYMEAPFYAEYERKFNKNKHIDDVVHQFVESHRRLLDKKTGLLFHGYDESRLQAWADPITGRSQHFWSRSLGWYAMALVDTLDHVENKKSRKELIRILQPLLEAIAQYQDAQSGLWFQVTDKSGEEGNYLEASASSMFIYSFAKAARLGLADKKYKNVALRAYEGLKARLLTYDEKTGKVTLNQICRSAGLGGDPYRDGSYEYYVHETDMVSNDAHGIGSLLLALVELARE